MKDDVFTKETRFGVFYSNEYPQKAKNQWIFGAVFFFALAVLSVVGVYFLLTEVRDAEDYLFVLVAPLFFALIGVYYVLQIKKLDEEYYLFLYEVKTLKEKKAKEAAYQKEHEDDLFYKECAKNGVHSTSVADIARMKIIAKQMNITCSDEELKEKYLKGKAAVANEKRIAAEKERRARIPVLRSEERLAEQEAKKYINLVGSEKRIKMLLDQAAHYRSEADKFENAADSIQRGADALYSLQAGKETDWAVHGGVASAIAGPAAGVAVAADIQRKNAEIRASNEQLSQSIGQFSAEQQLNMWMRKSQAEEKMKHCEAEAEKAKLKLVESLPQDELLKLLSPVIEKTTTSETGAITFTVSINNASLTIYETVKAVVDGSFKVKIMDGERVAGEAYFTLPYNGSKWSTKITSICASLPEDQKKYSFVFAPHNLFAIEL